MIGSAGHLVFTSCQMALNAGFSAVSLKVSGMTELCTVCLHPLFAFLLFPLIPTELTWEHLIPTALARKLTAASASLESPAVATIKYDFDCEILPAHKCRERDPDLLRRFITQSFLDLKYADNFGEITFGIPNEFSARLYQEGTNTRKRTLAD